MGECSLSISCRTTDRQEGFPEPVWRWRSRLGGQVGGIAGGDFANAPAGGNFFVFGRGYSNIPNFDAGYVHPGPPNFMTIIGFFKGDAWQFYSQEVAAQKRIVGTRRIR
jgi:hypothetical protein